MRECSISAELIAEAAGSREHSSGRFVDCVEGFGFASLSVAGPAFGSAVAAADVVAAAAD